MYILIYVGDDSHEVYYVTSVLSGLSFDHCGLHALHFSDFESCERMRRYIYKEYFLRVSSIYVPNLCPHLEVSNE